MESADLKTKRMEFLQDTLTYYVKDVSRRAVIGKGDDSVCKYRTRDGRMCAIGRHIPEYNYHPNMEGISINDAVGVVVSALPKEVADLGIGFLQDVQQFHDCNDNWSDSGLSKHGKKVFGILMRDYQL